MTAGRTIDNYLIDMDGVLVSEERLIPGAIVAGMEAGLQRILVLTGISTRETAERFPYRPSLIVDSVADLLEPVESGD
jgi:ribonucleotide monophosphatase NagD (HAD superfamily)